MKRVSIIFIIIGCLLYGNALKLIEKKKTEPLYGIKNFDGNGNLAFLDIKKKEIMFFDRDFNLKWKKKIKGEGPGEIKSASIMGINDFIYIYDDKSRKVVLYSKEGKLLKDIKVGKIFVGLKPMGEGKWIVVEQNMDKKVKKIIYEMKITENFKNEGQIITKKIRPFGFKSITQFWENYIPFDYDGKNRIYFVKGRGYEIYVFDVETGKNKLFYKENLKEFALTKAQEKAYKSKIPKVVRMLVGKIKSLPVVDEIICMRENVVIVTNILSEDGEKRKVDIINLKSEKIYSFWSSFKIYVSGERLIEYESKETHDVYDYYSIEKIKRR